jgi:hypothetical protein
MPNGLPEQKQPISTIDVVEIIGFGISALLMAGIFLAAIFRIAWGAYGLILLRESPSDLARVLRGIEYLFLAPLVLLAYVSMIRFVRGHFPKASDPHFMAMSGHMVHSVKLSLGILVIAILLTDLAERALTGGAKDWLNLVGECVTVLLGLGYVVVIQRFSHHE